MGSCCKLAVAGNKLACIERFDLYMSRNDMLVYGNSKLNCFYLPLVDVHRAEQAARWSSSKYDVKRQRFQRIKLPDLAVHAPCDCQIRIVAEHTLMFIL